MVRIFIITFFSVVHISMSAQSVFRTACQGNLARLDSMLVNTPINSKDNRERSLIHWAVACNQEETFNYLIKNGININAEDDQDKTPLHMAFQYGRDKFIDLIIEHQTNNDWKEN